MNWRIYLLLALLGLALSIGVAQFQHFPGYLDSDYYFAGGVQLAQGKGFSEPYLWNYLDDPQGLPHPSHGYWLPLSSIIAAAGLWLTGRTTLVSEQATYEAGRLGFLILSALVPVVTAALAYQFSRQPKLGLISGLLAVFSVYYTSFLPVIDNYGPYLVLGGLYFLLLGSRRTYAYLFLGAVAGLMSLARSDGILWFGLTMLLILWRFRTDKRTVVAGANVALALCGFFLVMGPWFWRTYSTFGTPMAPGGGHLVWLKSYDETFAYPADQITFQAWLSQGWIPIISARLSALRWNLLNAFAAQGEIFLLPFILIAIWRYRGDERVRLAVLGWLALFLVMTVIFPFAGSRGGFFHSGAAVQAVWWALAPLGLESLVAAARKRNWFTPEASTVFQGALVGITLLMTAFILYIRVLSGWGEGEQGYPKVETFLEENGIRPGEIVMVRNPPGYYLMTGRPAIVVPLADEAGMLAAATRYHAGYVVIEAVGAAGPIKSIYENEHDQHFEFLGELDGTRIFKVQP